MPVTLTILRDSRTMQLFRQAGFYFDVKNKATFHGGRRVEIGFIAVRSGETCQLIIKSTEVIEERQLSDHAPVISIIEMNCD
ncbi:MAG: hypothetical protein HRT88_10010 [Lentisphaeraceae bacterium]|nr:hypothetical protein [Lentisphaeraceae bacterium]